MTGSMSAQRSQPTQEPSDSRPSRPRLVAFVKRIKSAFRRKKKGAAKEPPPEPSSSAAPGVVAEEERTTAEPQETRQEEPSPVDEDAPEPQTADPVVTEPAGAAAEGSGKEPESQVPGFTPSRQRLLEDRGRLLSEKYNIKFEPDSMPLSLPTNPNPVERVHRPVRVRVHRYCHRCEAVFGPTKACLKCGHSKCKKCPRYPKEHAVREAAAADDGRSRSQNRDPLAVMKSPRNCQILVHRPIVQRVRRTCHKCGTQFSPAYATYCCDCGHGRCTKCPRDPEKRAKWQSGYPGDAQPSSDEEMERERLKPRPKPPKQDRVFRKPRQRLRWQCERCQTLFQEGSKTCKGCGHRRCDGCLRHPPRRDKENVDPAVAASLHGRLSALAIGGEASS